jgi:hypothetical protein
MALVCDCYCCVDGIGPVEYGKPMWFQLWDAELTTTTDHLLSSKVTGHFCTHRTQIPDTDTDTPISIPSSTLIPGLY